MASKLGIAEEEADESQYWLELLNETGYGDSAEYEAIHKELDEIIAMLVSSRRTINRRIQSEGNHRR